MFENRVTSALPKGLRLGIVGLVTFVIAAVMFNQVFFYAEPGYVYHVRTITGNPPACPR